MDKARKLELIPGFKALKSERIIICCSSLGQSRRSRQESIFSPGEPKPQSIRGARLASLMLLAAVAVASGFHPAALFAASSITYVQGNYATPQSGQTSVTVPFTAAQTAGDLNVIVVGWNDSTATVKAVTDKSGNTYALAMGPTLVSGSLSQSIYYAKNIAGAAAGANSVTVTFSTAAAYPDIRILEYSGADPTSPVDVTAVGSGDSTESASGTAATKNATDLIFGANIVTSSTSGPDSGSVERLLTSPDGDIVEDRMVTAEGSYSVAAPLSSSGAWVMQMVAFRTASGALPPTAPGSLTAKAASASQINLSWTASTSSVGIANYRVERCQGAGCTNFAQIATPTGTTYNDTNLSANTTYSYRVRATDTSGNLGPYSSVASATTPSLAASTIAYVQGNYATPQSGQTSVTVPFTAAQTAGDLNVIVVGWNDSTATVKAVTDKSGNTYALAVGPTLISGSLSQSIYYAKNIAGAAAGANSVTVTFSTAAAYPDIRILEYSGADPTSPVDVTAVGSGDSTESASGTAATKNAADLIFGANIVTSATSGPDSGSVERLLTSPDGDIVEDQMVTAEGSYSVAAPLSSSGAWVMQMVAFRAASGTSGASGSLGTTSLTASPASLSFGNVTTGSTSTLPVVLSNTGSSSVSVSLATVSGTGFRLSGSFAPITLAAGQNTSFSVVFAPTAVGSVTGSVSVVSTASNSPAVVALSGTGVDTHSVTLSWQPSASSGIAGYNVYRGVASGGPYTKCNSSLIAGTTYKDSTVQAGQTYYYVSTAVTSANVESSYSNQVEVTVPLP